MPVAAILGIMNFHLSYQAPLWTILYVAGLLFFLWLLELLRRRGVLGGADVKVCVVLGIMLPTPIPAGFPVPPLAELLWLACIIYVILPRRFRTLENRIPLMPYLLLAWLVWAVFAFVATVMS